MHPFYHPTTVLIVDDDPTLINTLKSLLTSNNQLFRAFNNPKDAIIYAKQQEKKRPLENDFFSAYSEIVNISELERGDLLIKLKTSSFSTLLENPQRFHQITVAIVDHDMPDMTGLELCREMSDLPIKKIMLTGQASHAQAINAFNENIIDCFLSKREEHLEDKLEKELLRLQKEFFYENTEALKLACSLQETEFIKDPAFKHEFSKILSEHGIIEYYLNTHPPGLLMFKADGTPLLLLIYDQQRLRAHYEIAQEAGASSQLLSHIFSHKVIPLFPTKSGYYEKFMYQGWQDFLWPAKKISGEKDWYLSQVINDDFLKYGLENYISYENYQKSLLSL